MTDALPLVLAGMSVVGASVYILERILKLRQRVLKGKKIKVDDIADMLNDLLSEDKMIEWVQPRK